MLPVVLVQERDENDTNCGSKETKKCTEHKFTRFVVEVRMGICETFCFLGTDVAAWRVKQSRENDGSKLPLKTIHGYRC